MAEIVPQRFPRVHERMIPDVGREVRILELQQLQADQRARLGRAVDARQLRQDRAPVEKSMGDHDVEVIFRQIHIVKETTDELWAIAARRRQLRGGIDADAGPLGMGLLDAANQVAFAAGDLQAMDIPRRQCRQMFEQQAVDSRSLGHDLAILHDHQIVLDRGGDVVIGFEVVPQAILRRIDDADAAALRAQHPDRRAAAQILPVGHGRRPLPRVGTVEDCWGGPATVRTSEPGCLATDLHLRLSLEPSRCSPV